MRRVVGGGAGNSNNALLLATCMGGNLLVGGALGDFCKWTGTAGFKWTAGDIEEPLSDSEQLRIGLNVFCATGGGIAGKF